MSIIVLIKIFGIILVVMCCLIAVYTDVKFQVIPNKLNFLTLLLGVILVTSFYILKSDVYGLLFYYFSMMMVFGISYVIWRLGIWAGGDVKLFTAISSLLIKDFLMILPVFSVVSVLFPYDVDSVLVPTFLVMFNSLLSVVPLTVIYISIIIIKDKPNLTKRFNLKNIFNESLLSLSLLLYVDLIISFLDIHILYLKIILLIIFTIITYKIINRKYISQIATITMILYKMTQPNQLIFIEEIIIFNTILLIKTTFKEKIVRDALTDNININKLKEGMILAYPLKKINNNYTFDKKYNIKGRLLDNENNIISLKASGLTKEDIKTLQEINKKQTLSTVPIKKAIPFAPFILAGLITTLTLGNTPSLILTLLGGF